MIRGLSVTDPNESQSLTNKRCKLVSKCVEPIFYYSPRAFPMRSADFLFDSNQVLSLSYIVLGFRQFLCTTTKCVRWVSQNDGAGN